MMSRKPRRFDSPGDFWDWLDAATADRFSRRACFERGNLAALFDAVWQSLADAPHGSSKPDDAVSVPRWVLQALLDSIAGPVLRAPSNSKWRQTFVQDTRDFRRFQEVWFRKLGSRGDYGIVKSDSEYRADRVRHHRLARQVGRTAVVDSATPYPWTLPSDPDDMTVFEAAAKTLGGGSARAFKKSYEKVTKALSRGEAWRYYPSRLVAIEGVPRSTDNDLPR